ncbi:DeoR/GlpR family DNA-binding transcription regulator [Aureitalea marina]|nr:DeoR/GlpR family DNA-binding transcription regulator [Aureitalea marina]
MQILTELNESGFVKVFQLCEKFDVSSVTIRKDLTFLEKKGLLFRTHGGASKQSLYAFERNLLEKESLQVDQKKEIAEEALKYVRNNDNIIMASGTTVQYLARMLSDFSKLTVLTTSLYISIELCKHPLLNVIQVGGSVRKSSKSVVGPIAEQILSDYSCNTLFLGVDGIDAEYGLTTSNSMEAHLNKTMINCSEKVVVLTDSSKIGKRSFGKIAETEQVHVLITDAGIKKKHRQAFEDKGIEVIVAG